MCRYTARIEPAIWASMKSGQIQDDLQIVLNHVRAGKCSDCIVEAQRVGGLAEQETERFVPVSYFDIAMWYLICTIFMAIGVNPNLVQICGMIGLVVGIFVLHKWMERQRE